MIDTQDISDNLSRTVKLAVDSGEAATLEEAKRLFEGYRLRIHVGPDAAHSATLQAALLTAVNAARRCFLGGVEVAGCPDEPLLIHWRGHSSLAAAVAALGGRFQSTSRSEAPEIVIGDVDTSMITGDFAVRATFEGWTGAVAPVIDKLQLAENTEFTPAGVLAGGLAVSEAFQYIRGRNAYAGRRPVGVSLWNPQRHDIWSPDADHGPLLELLPRNLWIIGLGHLGQAFLWALGLLPFTKPSDVRLVLQDTDRLVAANDSTSPLTDGSNLGKMKTRAVATWAEERGFTTAIIERLFSDDLKINFDEPRLAICGVDNSQARRALESAGFDHVIEAGLGKNGEEYLAFQIHTFPGGRPADCMWSDDDTANLGAETLNARAYDALAAQGLDRCGLTTVAGRSVGASFVGLVTSTLTIAEILRRLAGGPAYDVIDGTLRDLSTLTAIKKEPGSDIFNPGYSAVVPIGKGASS